VLMPIAPLELVMLREQPALEQFNDTELSS
jgi:hypothetical protein